MLFWLFFVYLFAQFRPGRLETPEYSVEDVEFPENCQHIASPGDHIMFEYIITSGSKVHAIQVAPEQYHHVALEANADDRLLHRAVKGMCENSTRILRFVGAGDKFLNLDPILYLNVPAEDGNTEMKITVQQITPAEDFEIFLHMKTNNISGVIDLIDAQRGVNAIDEIGQSVLMQATQRGLLPVVASLLNARRPRVDVNMAKGNGFTALFYAVNLPDPSIMQALLRRGANPNAKLRTDGNRGNTALHLACLLEKQSHAKMLLEYGASPTNVNEYGKHPLQLLPSRAVQSSRRAFKRHFENAIDRINQAEMDGLELPRGRDVPLANPDGRGDL